jgi:hypothetical protein
VPIYEKSILYAGKNVSGKAATSGLNEHDQATIANCLGYKLITHYISAEHYQQDLLNIYHESGKTKNVFIILEKKPLFGISSLLTGHCLNATIIEQDRVAKVYLSDAWHCNTPVAREKTYYSIDNADALYPQLEVTCFSVENI